VEELFEEGSAVLEERYILVATVMIQQTCWVAALSMLSYIFIYFTSANFDWTSVMLVSYLIFAAA
jgi:hypothetical protein